MKKHAQFNIDCHTPSIILLLYFIVFLFSTSLVIIISTHFVAKLVSVGIFGLFFAFTLKAFGRSKKVQKLICTNEGVFVVLNGVEYTVTELKIHIANQFLVLIEVTPSAQVVRIKPIPVVFIKKYTPKKMYMQLLLSIRTDAIGKAIRL